MTSHSPSLLRLSASAPRALCAALAVLALVASALASTKFSDASFTALSRNPSSSFAAGTLTSQNSKNNSAVLTASSLRPGVSAQGVLTLTHGGDNAAAYTVSLANIANTPASPALSGALSIRVEDITGAATVRYNGTLAGLAATPAALGTFAAGQARNFRVTVTMAASPVNPALQGSSTQMTLTWKATA